MKTKLQNLQIASFALTAAYENVGEENIEQLKMHLLDSLGSLFYSVNKPTIKKLVKHLEAVGEGGKCKVPVLESLPFGRAAQFYTALIRYLDFMDNYLGKEATCHPSDNIGSLLAAAELKKTTGKDFLTAMAVAYQVECRLVEEIPVMKEGIDHTLLLSYSIIAGASRMLGLTEKQIGHALGIAGCFVSPTVTCRAAYTFEWKGFASSMVALTCADAMLLAKQGMTGPIAYFEGPKGFQDVFGMKLEYDWEKETFELIKKCILKRYNAEVHSQSAIEAVLELRNEYSIDAHEIKQVDVTTFFTAYHIIGSGAYGNRKIVETKEQADHSLFYLVAVALLDGDIYPEQLKPSRINSSDVQELLHKVFVHTKFPIHKPVLVSGMLDPYTEVYPDKLMAKVEITLNDGRKFACKKEDYPGFHTQPFTWEQAIEKFDRLASDTIDEAQIKKIVKVIRHLEEHNMDSLMKLITIPQKVAH
jgi:2-methylcitrate dehydratase